MIILALLLLVSSGCSLVFADPKEENVQIAAPRQVPNNPAGKMVRAYIEAFNSGEEAMDGFQQQYLSEDSLKNRSKEERMSRYRQIKADLGTLAFQQMTGSSERSISFLARSSQEWLEFGFDLDPTSQKITSIRVEQSNGPEDSTPAESLKSTELIPSIDKALADLSAKDQFSGVVLLAKDGKPIYQKAFGLASKRYGVPNQIDTKFNIGSICKTFTAVAIQQLAAAGKLSLDDKIDRYLPDFPADKASKITIRQLLDHRSGLGDFFNQKFIDIAKDKLLNNNDYIALFRDEPLQFEPGTNQRYSNAGYSLLGAIIEKVSGQGYYDYIREHVTIPAGMSDTDSYASDLDVPNLATGYTHHFNGEEQDSTEWRNTWLMNGKRPSAAGGGYSTAPDLLKFGLALQTHKLPMPEEEEGKSAQIPDFGYAGGSPGDNSLIETYGRGGYILVVLSNYDPPSAESVGHKIMGWLRNLK